MKKTFDIFLRLLGCITLLFLLLWIFNRSTAQNKFFEGYRITPGKVAVWTGYAVAGAVWGAREAYHADPAIFEKRWGVDEYSFFGSEAWQRNYEGNRYAGPDGSINPHKGDFGNTFRDVHHFAGVSHNVLVIGCTFGLATGKQKVRHKLLDAALGMVIRSAVSNLTYNYLRQ